MFWVSGVLYWLFLSVMRYVLTRETFSKKVFVPNPDNLNPGKSPLLPYENISNFQHSSTLSQKVYFRFATCDSFVFGNHWMDFSHNQSPWKHWIWDSKIKSALLSTSSEIAFEGFRPGYRWNRVNRTVWQVLLYIN